MSQDYDKILKENIDALIAPIIRRFMGIVPVKIVDVSEDVQRTIERRPDFVKLVSDAAGTFVLHLEFQTSDEPDMRDRMLEYCALLRRKHGLEVRQYVLFLKKGKANMPTEIREGNLHFHFNLINFYDFKYTDFLQSNVPEEIILAILADFGDAADIDVVGQILQRVNSTETETLRRQKCVNQLEILANLRKLQDTVTEYISRIMPFLYDLTTDLRYQQGVEDTKKIMDALLLEQQQRALELERQKQAEQQRALELERQKQAEQQRALELERQKQAEQQRALELERQKQAEQQRALELERQKKAEQQRALEERRRIMRNLSRRGFTAQDIAETLGLDLVYVDKCLSELND